MHNGSAGHEGYDAARTGVAVGDRGTRGWLRVSGADAVSFLHGILTNDIASLKAGQWCYAAYLTPQGRMVSDMRVLRHETDLAIETEPHTGEMLAKRLDASIFTERVEIAPESARNGDWERDGPSPYGTHAVVVCGPGAYNALAGVLGSDALAGIAAGEFVEADRGEARLTLIAHEDLGVPAVDALGSRAACDALQRDVLQAGAASLGPPALEALRIEAGTPRFGADMTEDTIPLEAGIERRAISMTKGCYVGQEVIIRILHRGHGRVARRLVGLAIAGHDVPAAGSPLAADGRTVGAITSAVFSPRLAGPLALGYLHRDFVVDGARVAVLPTGTSATVTPLPISD
jgi:tRNA-modifying protein YgfZ